MKYITAAFLAALIWRRPLNSVFNHYHSQKIRKAAQEDRDWSAGLDDKQVDGRMNGEDYIMEENLHK